MEPDLLLFLEILNYPLVLLCLLERREGAEVAAFTRRGIFLS